MIILMCRLLFVLLLTVLLRIASGDVVCDGVDDVLSPALNMNLFLSTATGTMTVVVKPVGAAVPSQASGLCYHGQTYLSDADLFVDIGRTADFDAGGQDRVCVGNYTGAATQVGGAYTIGAFTHLTWLHTDLTLTMWQDGQLRGSVASDVTEGLLDSPLVMCLGETVNYPAGAGTLALAEVYPTAVPAAEIQALGIGRLHWLASVPATGRWELSDCPAGASGHGVSFADHSGNGRSATGAHGANASGLGCAGSTWMSWPWGVSD